MRPLGPCPHWDPSPTWPWLRTDSLVGQRLGVAYPASVGLPLSSGGNRGSFLLLLLILGFYCFFSTSRFLPCADWSVCLCAGPMKSHLFLFLSCGYLAFLATGPALTLLASSQLL